MAADTASLKLVNRAPNAALSTYRAKEDGQVVSVQISLADYRALALPGVKEPPRPGGLAQNKTWEWVSAGEFYRFDTPSGLLTFGDAWYEPDGSLAVCDSLDGKTATLLEKEHFVYAGTGAGLTITPEPQRFSLVNGSLTKKAAVRP